MNYELSGSENKIKLEVNFMWTKIKLKVRYMDEHSNEWTPWHWHPWHIMHARYHFLSNYIWQKGFWKVLNINKIKQFVHIIVINHRSTFSHHVEINKKLNHVQWNGLKERDKRIKGPLHIKP